MVKLQVGWFRYKSINSFIIFPQLGFFSILLIRPRRTQDCSRTMLRHFTHRLQRFIGKSKNEQLLILILFAEKGVTKNACDGKF